MIAENSQLAVVQGLVLERSQVTSLGAMVFKGRCCRLSYGVLCREEYDPNDNPTHIGQRILQSPLDGKYWVEGQIDWLLKQVCRVQVTNAQSHLVTNFLRATWSLLMAS